MINELSGFKPNIAIPPGETLKEYLESVGMAQVILAKRIGLAPKTVNEIINGKAPITAETAIKLESIFITPSSFWNNLEANYQETKARLEDEKRITEEIEIARKIPYSSIAKQGFLSPANNAVTKVIRLRTFFGVSSLHYIPDLHTVAFRIEKDNASSYALAAWLQMGEIMARNLKTAPYEEKKLRSLIPAFRELTLQPPEEFQPQLVSLCASCGIALVLVPHLPKTYAQGATRWLSKDKVLIQLSLRRKYCDIFWFSFFHEVGHILLHGKKQTFVEMEVRDEIEEEADHFVAEKLIPTRAYQEFINRSSIDNQRIIRFAKSIQIHPGIVVGKLQHDTRVNYNRFNDLRTKFIWSWPIRQSTGRVSLPVESLNIDVERNGLVMKANELSTESS